MSDKPTEKSMSAERTTRATDQTSFRFWLWVWGGATVAGGVWGAGVGCAVGQKPNLLVGPISGFFFGFVAGVLYAGSVGAAIVAIVAVVVWWCRLSRFQVVTGGVAGGLTGFVATLPSALNSPLGITSALVFLPVWIGAIGGAVAAFVYSSRIESHHFTLRGSRRRWQLSLRDLVAIIAVMAAIFAAMAFVVAYARMGDLTPLPTTINQDRL